MSEKEIEFINEIINLAIEMDIPYKNASAIFERLRSAVIELQIQKELDRFFKKEN